MKKQSKFFTDSEGRVRYIGNDRKAKDEGGAQTAKTETALRRGEKGNFITKDGKVIFVGGPGSGGGAGSGEATAGEVVYREPTEREAKRGMVAETETDWGTYSIYNRGNRIWIEAIGHGGAERRMPRVNSVEEAYEIISKYAKPIVIPESERITL